MEALRGSVRAASDTPRGEAATKRHAGCLALHSTRLRQRQVGMRSPFSAAARGPGSRLTTSPPLSLTLGHRLPSTTRLGWGAPAQAPGPAACALRLGAILESGFTKFDVRVGGSLRTVLSCTTYGP